MSAETLPPEADLTERLALRAGDPGTALRRVDDHGELLEEWSWAKLASRAAAIGSELEARRLAGQPILIAQPVGGELVASIFGCWLARAIAVPVYPPRGRRHRARFEAVRGDCSARLALGEGAAMAGLEWLDTSGLAGERAIVPPSDDPEAPCLIQYTSGSTAAPKGVMISSSNLSAQLGAFESILSARPVRRAVSWLPPYHDFGLVAKLLHSVWSGFRLTLMSPEHFKRRPVAWLETISRERADFSGAPNFALEWCARSITAADKEGLDLRSWHWFPMGAERVRAETLENFAAAFAGCGFDRAAFLPSYGLAESTLVVTTRRRDEPLVTGDRGVSTGRVIPGSRVRVVEDEWVLPDGEVGEIVVKGDSVSRGYWKRGNEGLFTRDGFLRTGDLGFLRDGELFVTSRIKDLIVVDGRNLAPEDVESVVGSASAAAFAFDDGEREQVVVLVESAPLDPAEASAATGRLRQQLARELDVAGEVVLVRAGTLPRTTSGKIRRGQCREDWAEGRARRLPLGEPDEEAEKAGQGKALVEPVVVADEDGVAGDSTGVGAAPDLLALVLEVCAEVTGRSRPEAGDDPARQGLSSLEATRLMVVLRERSGRALELDEVLGATSFAGLAGALEAAPRDGLPALERHRGRIPLTHSQERMWFLHRLDPDSAAYHVFGCLRLDGPLDGDGLAGAFRETVNRHAALRSCYPLKDGGPTVRVADEVEVALAFESAHPDHWESRLEAFASEPFRLDEAPLIRGVLVDGGGDRRVLGLCAHHVVADGWSARVFLADLEQAYRKRVEGSAAAGDGTSGREGFDGPESPDHFDYFDYAAWHRALVDGGHADRQVAYWKDRLAGHSGLLELATDFPRPSRVSSAGGLVRAELDGGLLDRVGELARERRVTPFMVMLAVFALFLRRQSGERDLVVAVPVANRNQPQTGGLVGTLVNTLPFRIETGDGSFAGLLDRVRADAHAMQANQDAPFEKIIEAVAPQRLGDRPPLAQVMFDHQELPVESDWAGGLRCSPYLASRGAAQFDLSLFVFALADRHELALEFRNDLFRRETVEGHLDDYLGLLGEFVADPGRDIDHDAGRAVLAGPLRPDFPRQTVPQRILATLGASAPERVVVRSADEALDAAGLLARARSFARQLRALGVGPGDRVALMLSRDANLPAGPLGVWLAGAAYIPLDPSNPPERLAMILADQPGVAVVADAAAAERLPDGIEAVAPDFSGAPAAAPGEGGKGAAQAGDHLPAPADTAYVIYTSGSTGRPKGVVIPHGALGNFILSMQEQPGMGAGDHLLAVTTLSFDISTLELFLPLAAGGSLEVVDGRTARDAAKLARRLEESGATVMQATPATWRMLLAAGWQGRGGLKVLCGGEAMDPALGRALVDAVGEVWNLYGPTETTVWSSIWKLPESADALEAVSIGEPIANTRLVILDEERRVVRGGGTGELCIGGDGLADGYWQRDELTAERFITPSSGPLAGQRLYRTGDLARVGGDGALECLGRMDGQVKLRGFRVELGEIEAAMAAHPRVANAACVQVGDGELVGWVEGDAGELGGLADFLRDKLPDYMVPARFAALDRLPLNASGKIDRRALAARPVVDAGRDAAVPVAGEGAASAFEHALMTTWGDLLGVSEIRRDSDFFKLGGHSLLAVRLVAEIKRRLGVDLHLDWIFEDPTFGGLLRQIREEGGIDPAEPRPVLLNPEGSGDPIFWMQTLVDGGMGLFPYREAVRLLGDGRLSYGMAEGDRVHDRMEDLAAAHVRSLREVQAKGPYRLAGFCFGGNLALEVAAQLVDAGEEVALLMLLESLPPAGWRGEAPDLDLGSMMRIAGRLPGQVRRVTGFDRETLLRRIGMKWRQLRQSVGETAAPVNGRQIPDIWSVLDPEPLDEAGRERALRHWKALHEHRPRIPAVGRLVLVRAADEGWMPRPRALGWEGWSSQPIEVFEVPGRHEDFLREGSAEEVAGVVRRVLGGIESGKLGIG